MLFFMLPDGYENRSQQQEHEQVSDIVALQKRYVR